MISQAATWNTTKFLRLRRRWQDVAAALRDASARQRSARDEVARLEGVEREQRERPRVGPIPSPELAIDLSRARARHSEARDHNSKLEREHAPLAQLVVRLEEFLRHRNVDPESVESTDTEELPAPARPASPKDLDAVRRRLKELQAERTAIATAPPSEAEIREGAHARVEKLRRAVTLPAARELVLRGGANARGALLGVGHGLGTLDNLTAQIEAMLARLVPEAVEAWIVEETLALAKARGGRMLPAAEQKANLDRLDALLFRAAEDEENLVDRLERAGATVERRPDADPRVVLGWLGAVD